MENNLKITLSFRLKLIILKIIKYILVKINFFLLPDLDKNQFSFILDKASNTYILKKKTNFINVLKIESTEYSTKLCSLGKRYLTDKSPDNLKGHRHPYTAVYDLLFNNFQDAKFNYAEIGILNNASIKMFRKYFKKANLYGFEFNKDFINKAKNDKLRNTHYMEIDVKNEKNILNAFKKTKKKLNIKNFEKNLYTKDMPNPDMLIRTGGHQRLSNFMLWQLAYAELFFLKKLWPDFNSKDLNNIVKNYKKSKRNFGTI